MTYFKKFYKKISVVTASILTLGLFAFPPIALAAPTLGFAPDPDAVFKVYEGGDYSVNVDLSGYIDDTTVDFYITGPMGEITELQKLIDSYEYISDGTYEFTWDGKFDGAYPAPGNYQVRLEGQDLFTNNTNTLYYDFELTEETNIEVTSAPASYDLNDTGDYTIEFDAQTAAIACMNLEIDNVFVNIINVPSDGSYEITWDGMIGGNDATTGPHTWRLYADGQNCINAPATTGELATGQVNVTDTPPQPPQVSNLSVSPNPFSPDGDQTDDETTISFDINGPLAVTVEIKDDTDSTVVNLMNNQMKPAGTVNVVWDGKDGGAQVVPDGTYTVEVTAADVQQFDLSTAEVQVDTSGAQEPQPQTQCAGFTDVDAAHPDCDAIEFVKSIGAMTGHPDGSFRTTEILQRDQVAKISLETFNLFDGNADYCNGNPAFPDVPESQWSYQYVCRGVGLGMITGYQSGDDAGKYIPARSVNRVEFLALILRNLDEDMPSENSSSYDDVEPGQWFSGYAKYSFDHSLFTGNNLNPTQQVSRLEVAQVLYKLDQLGKL